MRRLACLVLLVVAMPAAAVAGSVTRTPVGMPFWCDWGSDWDERRYTDNTEASFSSSPTARRTSA